MKRFLGMAAIADVLLMGSIIITSLPAWANSPLSVVYPPPKHETIAEKIFFIGTASPDKPVLINGKEITNRSNSGHFAPSLPLKMGENIFVIRQQDKEVKLNITRVSDRPEISNILNVTSDSLTPAVNIARLPNEPICVSAIAPPNTKVSAQIGKSKILLMPQVDSVELSANSAVLTSEAGIRNNENNSGQYRGCTALNISRDYGKTYIYSRKRRSHCY